MEARASRSRGREWLVLTVAVTVLSLSWLPRLKGPLDLRWDAAVYYELGTSLAAGRGYRLLNEPDDLEAVTYPPLLPAIVALHERIAGSADPVVAGTWLRRSFVFVWVGYLLAAYALLRARHTVAAALLGLALCGLHVSAIWLSDRLYADLPFAALATLFVVVAERPPSRSATVATWITGALAFLTRTVGVALFAAWIGEAVIRRRWRTVVLRSALAAIPILGWQAYIVRVETSESYRHPPYDYARAPYALYNVPYLLYQRLRDPNVPELGSLTLAGMAGRAVANARAIPSQLGGAVSASESEWIALITVVKSSRWRHAVPWIAIPIGLIALGLVTIAGLVSLLWNGRIITVLAVAAYVAELCLLPWIFHWPRYLAGIAPLLVLAFFTGCGAIVRACRLVSLEMHGLAYAPAAAVLTFQLVVLVAYFERDLSPVEHAMWNGRPVRYQLFGYDRTFEAFDRGLDWIIEHGRAGDVVASSMAPWAYIRTNAKAVLPPLERDPAVVQRQLDSVPVRYVIVDSCGLSFTREYTLPMLTARPERWTAVYDDPAGGLTVYQRK